MAETIDDSLLFALRMDGLNASCIIMERFQTAYNWSTNWPKSSVYAIGHRDEIHGELPSTMLMPTITVLPPPLPHLPPPPNSYRHIIPPPLHAPPPPPSQFILDHALVQVSRSSIKFLRVHINDHNTRLADPQAIILSFAIPSSPSRFSITVLRRNISQCLYPKSRARLVLQPLSSAKAASLQATLASFIFKHLSLMFSLTPALLFLPVFLGGFGFPSIINCNAAAALSGTLRDLNHHIPLFSSMARITLADCTAQLRSHIFPFARPGIFYDAALLFDPSWPPGYCSRSLYSSETLTITASNHSDASSLILSDHLNSIRLYEDCKGDTLPP